MISEGNANLRCIQIDDETATYPECSDWLPKEGWCIDPWTTYSEDCSLGMDVPKPVDFTLFPNPVSTVLTITGPDAGNTNFKAEIFTMEGKAITSKFLSYEKQASIDVSNLSSGIYFLNLENDNGRMEVKKFIKD